MAKKQIVASAFNVTAAPEDGAKGSRGQLPYPAGEYDLHTSYICTDMVAPYVLYNGIYYVMNQITTWVGQGVPSNINNPQKDYAVNGTKATWIPFENYKAIYVEILMANFAKLASAVFSGDYMFSQQGVDADGNPTSNYEEFNTGNFTPNLLLDFATGSFAGNTVKVNGGVFKNIRSPNDSFKIDEEGNVEIIGKISTSLNGTRIEIAPESNSIKLYNQYDNEVGDISFLEEDYQESKIYYPRIRLRRYRDNRLINQAIIGDRNVQFLVDTGSASYSCILDPIYGLTFYQGNAPMKNYPAS